MCLLKFKSLVLTDEFVNAIGLINNLFEDASYLTVVTPDWLGLTVKLITSLLSKPCEVETATCDVIFCVFAVTWVKLDSKRYSLLSDPL